MGISEQTKKYRDSALTSAIDGLLALKKMNKTDLARRLNCTPTHIYNRFNKPENFSIDEIRKIWEILKPINCPLGDEAEAEALREMYKNNLTAGIFGGGV